MIHRSDHLTDDAIAQFLRIRSASPEAGLLEDVMRSVEATPQDRPWLGLRPAPLPRRTLLVVAIALLLAAMGAIAVGSRLTQPDVPPIQLTLIDQVMDAVNGRDVAALRSAFVADGTLEFPQVGSSAGREGEVFMSPWSLDVEHFPEAWIGNLDKWGMEAELGSCRGQLESTMTCAVITRWHVLQVEIGEEWTFEFEGDRVRHLQMARVDPDPSDRVLPLGLPDLDRWAEWLRATHPTEADRLLPTGPDLFGHFYFRFGLDASPEEIGRSIREYLERGS